MRWQGYRREDESWCPPGPKDKWLQYSAYLAFVLWQPFVFRSRRRPTIRILTEPPRPHILFFGENVTFQSDGVPALIPIPGFPHYSGGCDHRLRWQGAWGRCEGTGRGTSVLVQRWTFDRLGCRTRWKLRGSGPPGSGPAASIYPWLAGFALVGEEHTAAFDDG